MKASEELVAARDELWAGLKPLIEAYEERTGLRIDEIAVDRVFVVVQNVCSTDMTLVPDPMRGIKVRTNASSL